MTTVIIGNLNNIQKQGDIYVATVGTASFLSDNTEDLLAKLDHLKNEELTNLFGASSTWTFVQSAFAEYWEAAEQIVTGKLNFPAGTPSHYLAHLKAALIRDTPKESIDAYEWVRDNAKGKVITWKYPLTDAHYYMFEDANDAMLFKLSVAV